jgi:amino acid transporter
VTLDTKRILVGRPLRTTSLRWQLLPKALALAVFCSDPISSVAYATQEILVVLTLGGLSLLRLTPWVALAGLVAASALLVDYVLTVAVSVVAGVDAVTSYAPALDRHAVALSLGCVVLLALVNLRGIKESGRGFAVPTYAFVAGVYLMFAVATVRLMNGEQLRAASAGSTCNRLTTPPGCSWLCWCCGPSPPGAPL